MTSRQLLWLLLKRWYVVVVGMSITFVVLWPATHQPGVYWAQVDLLLLPPTTEDFPNKFEDPPVSVAGLAGVVVSDFNGQHRPLLMASSETTLYGEGRTTGAEVRMANRGNQWRPLYPTATIDVQAVGASSDEVADQIQTITNKISSILVDRQEELGFDPSLRVSMISSPVDPTIYYVSGSRTRALGAGGFVGLCATLAGVYWFERLLQARRARRQGKSPRRRIDDPSNSSQAQETSRTEPMRTYRLRHRQAAGAPE